MQATLLNQAPHQTLRLDVPSGAALCVADGSLVSRSGGPLVLSPRRSPSAAELGIWARGAGLAAAFIRSPVPFWRVLAQSAATLRLAAPWPAELCRFRPDDDPTLHLATDALLAFDETCRLLPVSWPGQGIFSRLSAAPRFHTASGTGEIWAMSFGGWETIAVDGELRLDARLVLGFAGGPQVRLLPAVPRAGLPGKAARAWVLAFSGHGQVFLCTRHADEWAGQMLSTPLSQARDVRPE